MSPPLTNSQIDLLKKLYYDNKMYLGRDRLWIYLTDNYPDYKISRRQTMDWLDKQLVHQMYLRKKPSSSIRPILSNAVNDYWQIDLIDFSSMPSNGYNYILNIIDVLSRKLWLYPLRQKTTIEVKNALADLFKTVKPKIITSDNGGEFNVEGYFPDIKFIKSKSYTPQSQSIVEKSNHLLKILLQKELYINQNKQWSGLVQTIQDVHNISYNSSIKSTPNLLYASSLEKQNEVAENIKAVKSQQYPETDPLKTYKVGDRVRILDKNKTGKFDPVWSQQLYTIYKVVIPKTSYSIESYRLKDYTKKIVKGGFPKSELQVITEVEQAPNQKQVIVKKKLLSRTETDGIDESNIIKGKRTRTKK